MKKYFYILFLISFFFSCEEKLSDQKKILQIAVKEDPKAYVTIDSVNNKINIGVNKTVATNALTLNFAISPKAKISPLSGLTHDLTNPKTFVITAEDGSTQTFTISASNVSDEKKIYLASIPSLFQDGTGVISSNTLNFLLPYGTDFTNISINATLSTGATATPAFGVAHDYSSPVQHIIKAENGSTAVYTVTLTHAPQETGVRAVWVTNVASNVLMSEANLTAMVDKLAELNFNTICVSTYNKSQTLFPSQTLASVLGISPSQTVFTGCSWGDALAVLIEKAHAKNIKVIAWFEYGFASHVLGQESPISDKHPDWISKDINGVQTNKNNFYWLNGFHPDVQNFLTNMIVECVTKYNIDGIQGDDRLPALPSQAGYDDYTKQLYKSETGKDLPTSPTETAFFNWKVTKMTNYAISLYNAVKKARSNCLVTWAPSTRGWAKDNYLQDWPEWLKQGVADWISPQLYRSESLGISAYFTLIDGDLANVFTTAELRKKYVPGMLVRNGDITISDAFLAKLIQYNRFKGIFNESTWFYEGVPLKQNAYKVLYPGKAIFPF